MGLQTDPGPVRVCARRDRARAGQNAPLQGCARQQVTSTAVGVEVTAAMGSGVVPSVIDTGVGVAVGRGVDVVVGGGVDAPGGTGRPAARATAWPCSCTGTALRTSQIA